VDEARARWLPSFTATGGYTRNEVDVVVTIPTGATTSTQATITPLDQADLTLQVNVPVIDVGAWLDFAAAEASADASDRRAEATHAETDLAIATAYHQVIATRALLDAAVRGRGAAQASLERARARVTAALASDLEVARAEAEVARVDQQIADAELQVALAERNLEVLTGLDVGDERALVQADDLEAPPAASASDVERLAEVARGRRRRSRRAPLSRRLVGCACADGLGLRARADHQRLRVRASALWALGVQATFTLDFGRPARIGTRERQEALATLRRERALETARTRVVEARARLLGSIARVRAARAQESSAGACARRRGRALREPARDPARRAHGRARARLGGGHTHPGRR
jgi:outer membrane protein TolC